MCEPSGNELSVKVAVPLMIGVEPSMLAPLKNTAFLPGVVGAGLTVSPMKTAPPPSGTVGLALVSVVVVGDPRDGD